MKALLVLIAVGTMSGIAWGDSKDQEKSFTETTSKALSDLIFPPKIATERLVVPSIAEPKPKPTQEEEKAAAEKKQKDFEAEQSAEVKHLDDAIAAYQKFSDANKGNYIPTETKRISDKKSWTGWFQGVGGGGALVGSIITILSVVYHWDNNVTTAAGGGAVSFLAGATAVPTVAGWTDTTSESKALDAFTNWDKSSGVLLGKLLVLRAELNAAKTLDQLVPIWKEVAAVEAQLTEPPLTPETSPKK